jgi:hypothetical protein
MRRISMKTILTALTVMMALTFTAPAFAAPVDKNSPEHKAWVDSFRKKHDIKAKPAAKKAVEKKAVAKKKKK